MHPTPSIPIFLLALVATACTAPRPLRGGKASTAPTPAGLHQTITQGDNPSTPTRQTQSTIRTRTYTLPPGTRIDPASPIIQQSINPSIQPGLSPSALSLQPLAFSLPAPVPVTEREETHATTELGAAQKDTARELGAKLSSLKGIVWVGLGLFIFGLASIFWPPLRVIIGSITTSIAITLGGIALMILPTLIVGNELLILGGVALVIAAWFLAHRHGHMRGTLSALARTPAALPANPNPK